jgi:hypothetical protein
MADEAFPSLSDVISAEAIAVNPLITIAIAKTATNPKTFLLFVILHSPNRSKTFLSYLQSHAAL